MTPGVATAATRLVAGAALTWGLAAAIVAPELPVPVAAVAVAVFALTLWRPDAGLLAVVAAAPAGRLLGTPPLLVAEMAAWACLAPWLLDLRRAAAVRADARVLGPAGLLGLCLAASWLGAILGESAGIPAAALPAHLARTLPRDYLLFSAAAPETRALLQALAGLGLFTAARAASRADGAFAARLATTLVGSAALLGLLSLGDVVRQWAGVGFEEWFLARMGTERFAFHLPDANAAASHYALAALAALALALAQPARRLAWAGGAAAVLAGLALTGSRTAWVAVAAIGTVLAARATGRAWAFRRWRLAGLGTGVAAAAAIAAVLSGPASDQPGSAGLSLRIRGQFLQTSTAMLASAPAYGVGIGRYYERSPEFMPAALEARYPFENAHNYFAQMFAEVGILGGVLFLWLVVAAMWAAWPRGAPPDPWRLALWAGAAGYVVTCVTGHPLLVPESSLPFWLVLGAAASPAAPPAAGWRRAVPAAVLVLAAGVTLEASARPDDAAHPSEQGFHELEAATPLAFRWTTRHAVTYVEARDGFLRLPVQAPTLDRSRPWEVEIAVAGRVRTRERVPPGRWLLVELPIRVEADLPFYRVDLRVNQDWTPARDQGDPDDDAPRGIMVGPIRFSPAGP